LHRQRLLCQHHRVPRVHRHDAGAEGDAGHLRTGDGEQGQRIVIEDLRGEGVVQPGVGQPPQPLDGVGHRLVDLDETPDTQRLCHGPDAPSPSLPVVPATFRCPQGG